jgi:threonyl-tRNA synthetase
VRLAPEQVSVIPVSPAQADRAPEIHAELVACGLRSRLDAEDETLARRIAIAHHDGVPFVIVVGAREVTDGTLAVRDRRWSAPAADAIAELVQRCPG